MDIKHNEYEVLAAHLLGTIHWYCADCNFKSLELHRLVFGLQDRLRKSEEEIDGIKKDVNAKLSRIESEYEAVRDDIKALNQKNDDGIKHCMADSEKLMKSMQSETDNTIENVKEGLNTKVSIDEMETALQLILMQQKLTRNSSGDEIANVNFLYDDIVHALKMQQTLA